MGGFECADHLNAFGNRVNMIKLTGHDIHLRQDYLRLKELGINTIREGVIWSEVEKKPYEYDWSWVNQIIEVAESLEIQVVWDICHFGYPDDLTPLHPMFARRFSHLCEAFVRNYRSHISAGNVVITPINEVSFVSWLGGDARGTSPYCTGMGWDVKYHLMKAYIEGIHRMKNFDSSVTVMTTEPLINIVPGNSFDILSVQEAHNKNEDQFQILEMLVGNICPELGGCPDLLDIAGLNFYFNNQWVNEDHYIIPWGDFPPHPLWKPLNALVSEFFEKYQVPVVIAETSHPGEHRKNWLEMIANECELIIEKDIPLLGCCIYPVIDRPDWDFPEQWHRSGLWDIYDYTTLERVALLDVLSVISSSYLQI